MKGKREIANRNARRPKWFEENVERKEQLSATTVSLLQKEASCQFELDLFFVSPTYLKNQNVLRVGYYFVMYFPERLW